MKTLGTSRDLLSKFKEYKKLSNSTKLNKSFNDSDGALTDKTKINK